ncbi:MAG TPA: sigma-70 family RNA polymerase sigma factor [Streptosporangiaceae bacterium]
MEGTGVVAGFEEHRPHLRAVAYRMLGSLSEADDAVQETWLRASRADTGGVRNPGGWLTTVMARVCLNMLRSRDQRREEPIGARTGDPLIGRAAGDDPEADAVLADSVGVAMLVVLDTLSPAERLAFVLHDMFSVPFDDVAALLERSPEATRQLASRARRRVKGAAPAPGADLARQRRVVDAFLAAARGGDFAALVGLLHPDVVLRADAAVVPTPEPVVVRGARPVAEGAMAAVERARFTGAALVDGVVGLAMAPYGRLRVVLRFAFDGDLVTEIDVIADPDRLDGLEIGVLGASG